MWSYRLPNKKLFHLLHHVYIVNILYQGAYRGVPVYIHACVVVDTRTYLYYSPVISCACHPSMCSSSRDKIARHEPYVVGRGEESLLWDPGSELRLIMRRASEASFFLLDFPWKMKPLYNGSYEHRVPKIKNKTFFCTMCVIQHRNWPLKSTILDTHGTNASPGGLCTRTHTNEAFSC